MVRDLTNSEIDRQNILNNRYAIKEVQKAIGLKGVLFEGEVKFTKRQLSAFFEVSERAITNCLRKNEDELQKNGYEILVGNRLKLFKLEVEKDDAIELNFHRKVTNLALFNFRAFLNLAMLLTKSGKAKEVRGAILDIVIDTINKRTGGNTKYINQRDEDFIVNLLQSRDYHKELLYALKDCVDLGKIKYIVYNDKIYKSIFKENADEYRRILKLESTEDERHTMYSEVLNLIASYEAGFAEVLTREAKKKGRMLSDTEASELFYEFQSQRLWVPLVEKVREKMASRDLYFRDALHKNLAGYISSIPSDDFDKFIGDRSMSIEEQLESYIDALKRLKGRD